MSRMVAYLGPAVPLGKVVLDPPHNLLNQARSPRELKHADFNADGFGFGWYAPDESPACYNVVIPIWHDMNLPHLARSLTSDLWLAAVHHMREPFAFTQREVQPFCDTELLFMHNGFLSDFVAASRQELRAFISPDVEATIEGHSDSEHIFALLRHLLSDDPDLSMEEAIGQTYELIAEWLYDRPALVNLVVSDGERLFAGRHAVNAECPSLYYTTDDEEFPEAQLIASEPLTENGVWRPVPEDHLLVLDPEEPPELLAL